MTRNRRTLHEAELEHRGWLGGSLLLLLLLVAGMGAPRNWWSPSLELSFRTYSAARLKPGMPVMISGYPVGRVQRIRLLNDAQVQVTLEIAASRQALVGRRSRVTVTQDGLINRPYIAISPDLSALGHRDPISSGDTLIFESSPDIATLIKEVASTRVPLQQMLTRAGALMERRVPHSLDQLDRTLGSGERLANLLEREVAQGSGSLKGRVARATDNLETTLTTTARPQSKGTFVFTGEPAFAAILSLGGVDLANVANNHALDFGTKGAEETVQAVEAAGMRAFGDRLVDVRTIRGLELVNLGYVGGATDTEPRVRADVAKHKRDGNVVLVSFHWGAEGVHVPNDEQVRVGRAAIDAGADVVIGHHPHVIQGIDDYKGRKIVYSLGNFVFGGNGHPADTDAVLFQQAFAKGPDGKAGPVANTARVVPVKLGGPAEAFRPTLLQGAEKDRVLARVDEYSRALRRPGK